MNSSAYKLMSQNEMIDRNEVKSALDSHLAIIMAEKILAEVMMFRRVAKRDDLCGNIKCQKCASPHLTKLLLAIKKGKPITFVLPAFPGKSPNHEKVLGYLPDYAEQLALCFLNNLCHRINKIYAPGIKIILCSDGRVFSDVIGMREEHVSAYQVELDNMIQKMLFLNLSTFNLDDIYNTLSFEQMRKQLMENHGISLDALKVKVKNGGVSSANAEEKEANRMFCGITRFLFEDAIYTGKTKSRTAIQKESRAKAYEVIRRSNAWSQLIADLFPEAIRLSIHPQACGSKKLGIRLISNEIWMTPWHGVAVESEKGYVLLKRAEAENLGASLICFEDGRGSHYKLEKGC